MTWRDEVRGLREQGFDVLDWLSAVQHADGAVVITACLLRSEDPGDPRLLTSAAPVESIAGL